MGDDMTAIKRDVTIGGCRLILGDCLSVMPLLGKFDAVVTSPPYDNLRDYGKDFHGVDLFAVIKHISEILKPGGVCMWNVADATINGSETGSSFRQALHAMDCGLRLHDTMHYIKDNVNFPEDVRYFSGHEYMFIFSNGSPKTFNPIMDRKNKFRGTIMHGTSRQRDSTLTPKSGIGKAVKEFGMRFNWWHLTNNKDRSGHPAPMPYSMATGHIESWTDHGETILDPFMGNATTLVACAKMGRRGTGIELDEGYFESACARVRAAYAQPDFFVAQPAPQPAPQPVQDAFDV